MRVIGATTLARDLGKWQDDQPAGRRRTAVPAYRALADSVRLLVLDGRIPLGVALPSERDLAAVLELSRTTITSAYAVLREEGYLVSRQGSRSTVALPELVAGRAPVPHRDGFGEPAAGPPIDLTCAAMAAPAQEVQAAYARALEALPAYLPGHGLEPTGLPVLREAVAERYRRRGLPTEPEQIMITSGAQHALVLLLDLLAAPGERVLIDHPTYTNAIEAIKRAGARPVPVPLRLAERDWDLDGIRSSARQTAAKLAYLVPDFHNPTGFCLDEAGRARLVEIARETSMTLIIDETMADLSLDVQPPSPVAAFARGAGRAEVISVGSASKSFWSGLRIGWIRAEPSMISALVAVRSALDLGTAVLEQLAAVSLIEAADRVLPARREQLRGQRAALLDAVATELPDWRCTPGSGGLALWMQLPTPMSTALAATAPYHGVVLAAGPRFGLEGAFERYVRLPYARGEDDLRTAVTGIAAAYRALSGGAELSRPALVI
ncbi:PLP-dependent aminotransferase family protein [Rhodococcus spelaei]|uniref:PLP-dependent aminotransferase family protein n=1 Tax=Rhodococcus spelaei TaxID=2546320 RepID=A0A541BAG5_9NOCA|nr:PLP-dependent aminotransferase family protein [Rhodococcus spelaei]TQF69317.1 PLP-dependent aminotransferase family protein [Rhodococcus spelaei]